MSHVVTEPCIGCKDTSCVTVCPVDCFYEGQAMLYINPNECIDCAACVSECPVDAIFFELSVPKKWEAYISINEKGSLVSPKITQRKTP